MLLHLLDVNVTFLILLPALRGNVEFEIIVVLNDILPNLNTVGPSVSESL